MIALGAIEYDRGSVVAKFKLEDGTEVEAFTKDELEALVSEQVAGLKRKNEELLGETKSEREKRVELERLQAEAEEAQAKERGEFKSLYEKTQAELEREREEKRTFAQRVQQKELDSAAYKLASQLTKDTKRAELLKREAMGYAKYTEEGVIFELGGMQIDQAKLLEKLRDDFPFLADGNQSSGGGANGNRGGGAAKQLKDLTGDERTELARTNPAELRRLVEEAKAKRN